MRLEPLIRPIPAACHSEMMANVVYAGEDDSVMCQLHPLPHHTEGHYAILIADIIRHTASNFDCNVEILVNLIDDELDSPTSPMEDLQ